MDPEQFTTKDFGTVTKRPGDKWAFWYFQPAPVPRDLALSSATVLALSNADLALGRLVGAGRLLKDPSLLVNPYVTREALASSRIEGTQASLSDVLKSEMEDLTTDSGDVEEVRNYIDALRAGRKLLNTLPISLRLIKGVHASLLKGVRGQERLPGEFRRSPVWIGSPTDSPDTATFVPPVPEDMQEPLADLERFINEPARLPVLIRCALLHYQFETIHPFLDGNGRLGRLLIILFLMEQGILEQPLLYVSPYMETNRRQYYERLQAVREHGEIQEWLQYFLTAVTKQAEDAQERARNLVDLRERYRAELAGTRSRASEVVDLAMANPFLTVRRVERALGLTNQGARLLIRALQDRGWLHSVGSFGRGGRAYWVAHEVFSIISGALESEKSSNGESRDDRDARTRA